MIEFSRLEDVVRATEEHRLPHFAMNHISICGSSGCLIGNYQETAGGRCCEFGDEAWFGMSLAEYRWLFAAGAVIYRDGVYTALFLRTDWTTYKGSLKRVTREEALARLKKFLAYKRRKHAALYDERYGVAELARRQEGNWGFVQSVLDEVAV